MIEQEAAPAGPQRSRRLLCATIDLSARFASLTPSWQLVLGWDVEVLLGDTFVIRVHPDDMESAVSAIHVALSSGSGASFAARYAHRNGTYLAIRWRIFPRLDSLLLELLGRPAPRSSSGAQLLHETSR